MLSLEKTEGASRFVAYCYMFVARRAFEKFGMQGEIAIRRGLRAYGKTRGQWMRKWHTEMGLPINVESINRHWDSELGSLPGEFKPYCGYSTYAPCTNHDIWKEGHFERGGYMYCDEIHQELAMAYHPSATVEIHKNLNKGDPCCDFRWVMEPDVPFDQIDRSGYEKMEKRMRENPEQEELAFLERECRRGALLHSCIAKSLIDQFGQQGESLVREALRELEFRLTEDAKAKLTNAGKKPTVNSILDQFDLPYALFWKTRADKISDTEFRAVVDYCPLAEVWKDVGHEKSGLLFCQEICTVMFNRSCGKGRLDAGVAECLLKNDKCCRLEFKI